MSSGNLLYILDQEKLGLHSNLLVQFFIGSLRIAWYEQKLCISVIDVDVGER